MSNLTKNQLELGEYLKDKDFDIGMKLAICLCCRDDKQARKMLDYCLANPDLEDYKILEKAVEIYQENN